MFRYLPTVSGVYVLELQSGKYYVGHTTNLQKRVTEHFSPAGGAAWTRLYHPTKVMEIHEGKDKVDENAMTLRYMQQYGIPNVRGGNYVQVTLEKDPVELESGNPCFGCGSKDHMIKDCPTSLPSSSSSSSTTKPKFRVSTIKPLPTSPPPSFTGPKFTVSWRKSLPPLPPSLSSSSSTSKFIVSKIKPQPSKSPSRSATIITTYERSKSIPAHVKCYKCHRPGHYATTCYAKTRISDGRPLQHYNNHDSGSDSEWESDFDSDDLSD